MGKQRAIDGKKAGGGLQLLLQLHFCDVPPVKREVPVAIE
jgi:hypothetical protein